MKRVALIALLLIALPAVAAEKWWDTYKRGVTAVQGGNFQAGIDALQSCVNQMPNESASVRPKNETFTYVPHYWLGVAKLQLGDPDGALHEWKQSEDQGAIQHTPLYAQLRDGVGKAQSQKQHASESASADLKKDANAAVGRALSAQMDAVAAGADRSDTYRAAQRKLQEAMEAANSNDPRNYRHASDAAQQARDLFASAADVAKKQKAARPPVLIAKQQPAPQPVAPAPVAAPPPPVPAPIQTSSGAPAPSPAVSKNAAEGGGAPLVKAELSAPPPVVLPPAAMKNDSRDQLQSAYRAFAAGDLTSSEQMLSGLLTSSGSGEAYLLRGCVRYTRSMLSRQPDMRGAASDFRAAIKANPALRLDRRAFSPKLVAFFEDLKKKL